MTTDSAPANSRLAKIEHRRSKRFPVFVPAEVKWHGPAGVSIKQEAQAEEVNAQGGLLRMETYPNVGDIVEVTNLLSTEAAEARVLGVRHSAEGEVRGIAVELLVHSETFWGVEFQLKKSTAELLKLGQALRSGSADVRVLREFRDAVDYIRKTAWAVDEWEERHRQRRSSDTVLSLLTAERIRRATHLCNELAAEVEASEVSFGTKGVAEFYRAVDRIYETLERSFTYRQTQ